LLPFEKNQWKSRFILLVLIGGAKPPQTFMNSFAITLGLDGRDARDYCLLTVCASISSYRVTFLSLSPDSIYILAAHYFPDCCQLGSFASFRSHRKANARLTTIDKLDAGCLKRPLERFDCSLLQFISSLKPGNRVDRHLRSCCEFSNAQAQSRTGHATLDGKK
jgi:hypothetical protein